jgi:hypothetical protein
MTLAGQKTLRRVVWRRILDDRSFADCVATTSPDGIRLSGKIISAQDGEPLSAP